jgi:predicted ATP-grasp superfamily ATP-dependent carboligase
MSAVFTSAENRCRLIGVTEQLCGEPWLHARPFQYAGNVGPLPATPDLASELTLLGYRLVMKTGIRGVWGVDFVLHGDRPTVVEVNPRYPASVEVIEHGLGESVFRNPFPNPLPEAERGLPPPPSRPGRGDGGLGPMVGKAIYFAPHPIIFPPAGPWDRDLAGAFDPWRLPDFADIPDAGEVIEPGHPVLTFLARGSTADECRAKLNERATQLDRLFEEHP